MPTVIDPIIQQFLTQLAAQGSSALTRQAYRADLTQCHVWLVSQGSSLASATTAELQAYLSHRDELSMAASSAARLLSALRHFYPVIIQARVRRDDPTLPIKHRPRAAPVVQALTEQDVDRLLNAPDPTKAVELRDKAMLEVLYATGVRVSELVNLDYVAWNQPEGLLHIQGSRAPRLIPLGEEAQYWLSHYDQQTRNALLQDWPSTALFPSNRGIAMTRQTFWHRIKLYANRCGIEDVSPKSLRHAFALHLIAHGADLKVMQHLLGHADLSSTQLYTHILDHRLTLKE